jgi:hypothetical protein
LENAKLTKQRVRFDAVEKIANEIITLAL